MNKKGTKIFTEDEKELINEGYELARFFLANSDRTIYELFPEMEDCESIGDLVEKLDYLGVIIRITAYYESVEPGDIVILPNNDAAMILGRNNSVEDNIEFIYFDEKGNLGSTNVFYHTTIKTNCIGTIKDVLRREINIHIEKDRCEYGKKCSATRNDVSNSV